MVTPASDFRSTSPTALPKRLGLSTSSNQNAGALPIRSGSARHLPTSRSQSVDWPKCRHATADRPQILLGHLPDSEIIHPLAGLQFRSQPARRLSASRPRLGRPIRIPKLRNDGWIWAPPCRRALALGFHATLELFQAIFEYALLREQRGCKP